jgi:hypothetical protein
MARSAPDLTAASLICDYLADAASITAGVPSNETLPKQLMDTGEQRVVPSLICNALESSDTGGGLQRTVTVGLLLPYYLKNGDADSPTDAASLARAITRATASEYIDIIERRLRDLSAFDTFLTTLDSGRLDGWRIIKMRVLRQPNIERERQQPSSSQMLSAAVELVFAWAR